MRLVRFIQIGVATSLLPALVTIGSLGSTAGAAGAGYQGTPPVLPGPGGVSFPVVSVSSLSSLGQNMHTIIFDLKLHIAVPLGDFSPGEQLVLANASRVGAVPGFLKVGAFQVSVYRHGTPTGGKFNKGVNVIIESPGIRPGDRVFQKVGGRWDRVSYKIFNGRAVVGLHSSGLLEVVKP